MSTSATPAPQTLSGSRTAASPEQVRLEGWLNAVVDPGNIKYWPGMHVRTGTDERAQIEFPDRTLARLGANTQFRDPGEGHMGLPATPKPGGFGHILRALRESAPSWLFETGGQRPGSIRVGSVVAGSSS